MSLIWILRSRNCCSPRVSGQLAPPESRSLSQHMWNQVVWHWGETLALKPSITYKVYAWELRSLVTKKLQKKSLHNILCWATLIAIFGHMQPSGCGFGMAVGHPSILEESTPLPWLHGPDSLDIRDFTTMHGWSSYLFVCLVSVVPSSLYGLRMRKQGHFVWVFAPVCLGSGLNLIYSRRHALWRPKRPHAYLSLSKHSLLLTCVHPLWPIRQQWPGTIF